jgi:hypothetical protein
MVRTFGSFDGQKQVGTGSAYEHHRGRHPYWDKQFFGELSDPLRRESGSKNGSAGTPSGIPTRHFYEVLERKFKVMQELMRHSSLRSTIDIYTQAVTPAKHAAQAAVLSLFFLPNRIARFNPRSKKRTSDKTAD